MARSPRSIQLPFYNAIEESNLPYWPMSEGKTMILRQFLHTAPVGISYLFGCGGKAAGAVVDPVGDIQVYVRAAEETGMRIRFVVDTHIHADHPSAARRLAEASGADYV